MLGCVSTQFLMMLNSPELDARDLSSLRCMFTGGEAVPYERAARFEDVTGARVLQFYGSNETGALSRTTIDDDREHRLQHRRADHPRDAGPAARRRRSRHHRTGRARQPGVQGSRHLLRLPRRRPGERRAVHRATAGCASATWPRSTPTATSASSAARPTSSSAAGRTSALPRSKPRSPNTRRSRSRRWWRCPTRSSANGCASTPSSARTRRSSSTTSSVPRRARRVARVVPRTARGARRAPPRVRRQGRQGRAP